MQQKHTKAVFLGLALFLAAGLLMYAILQFTPTTG